MADIALIKKAQTLQEYFEKYTPQIRETLPDHIKSGQFIRRAQSYCIRNPNILGCSPRSILQCMMQAASLGLQPDDITGMAYLVPFWNSKTKQMEAQFIVGYKGMLALAQRSGQVSMVDVHIVYEGEHFVYEAGLNPKLEHHPLPPTQRKEIVAAYAVAQMKDGSQKYVVLWYDDILKVRDKSAGYQAFKQGKVKQSVWEDWHDIMVIKTTIRYLAKFLPQSPELQAQMGFEESYDRGEPIRHFLFEGDEEDYLKEKTEEKALEEGTILKEKTVAKQNGLYDKLGEKNGQQ
jgi:recombination protein RecT